MPNRDYETRRSAIRALLHQEPAATQASLVADLTAQGHVATQSSVSRDLRELGVIKTPRGYELPPAGKADDDQMGAVADLMRSMRTAGPNLLVLHTAIGAAQRVALALDRSNWPEVVGNIGGDDTVFVATQSALSQKNLIARIERSASSRLSGGTGE
jgi:transcriptional regulator of arginine metabolism